MNAKIAKISAELYLITLNPPMEGFGDFISAWLYRGEISFLVDVGPSSTADGLLKALQDLNVDRLDFILLTHIHLDHAGAVGEIAAAYPQTPIICHPAAVPHLVDPARLWAGTRKVLGSMAEAYGPIQPVAADRLANAAQLRSDAVAAIMTPGHAPHHVSYIVGPYVFAGETGGVFYAVSGDRFYLRPATPPRFFLDTALQSVDLLIECRPAVICYGHYGLKEGAVEMLKIHRAQLLLWKKIIKEVIEHPQGQDPAQACMRKLLQTDSLMANFHELPEAGHAKEKYFIQNSILGFTGYLKGD